MKHFLILLTAVILSYSPGLYSFETISEFRIVPPNPTEGEDVTTIIDIFCSTQGYDWGDQQYILSWFSGIWNFGLLFLVGTLSDNLKNMHTSSVGFSKA